MKVARQFLDIMSARQRVTSARSLLVLLDMARTILSARVKNVTVILKMENVLGMEKGVVVNQ